MLCTANQCRSPMAEALMQARLASLDLDVVVSSAGELPGGVHASPGSVRAMAERGLDIAHHRSAQVTVEQLERADLVLAMGRRHLRHAVALAPAGFRRTFTLKELVRRGEANGPRRPAQTLADWLAALHVDRTTSSLLGDDLRDDVADPMGGTQQLYEATAVEISDLIDRVVELTFTSAERRETA